MEVSSRGVFLMFLIFFMFFSPVGNPPRMLSPAEKKELEAYLKRQEYEMMATKNSTWSTGYNYLTGLNEYPGKDVSAPGSILPKTVFDEARKLWTREVLLDTNTTTQYAYFVNLTTATLNGKWEKFVDDGALLPINMTKPKAGNKSMIMESPVYAEQARMAGQMFSTEKVGNITFAKGNVHLKFDEVKKRPEHWNVSLIQASMDLIDTKEETTNTISLHGVHLRETGNLVLSTNSLKFSGFEALPHMMLFPGGFNEAKDLVVQSVNRTVRTAKRMSGIDASANYDLYEDSVVASHKCEYIVYGHIRGSKLSSHDLDEIQRELEDPMGRPHKRIPKVELDIMMYSPDCGIAMRTTSALSGELSEQYYRRMRATIMFGILLLFTQTVFMAVQMRDTSTPSTISRVSFYSIGLMSVLDGSMFFAALAFSIIESVALSFLAVAFIAFALTAVFEMRYMVLIYKSQIYETVVDQTNASNDGQPALVARSDGRIVNPEPQTGEAQQATQPSPTGVVEDDRQIMGMVYSRFYTILLGFLILSLTALSWPRTLRRIYEYCAVLILYSFWLPQIIRNVNKGSRRSFLWSYVLATSAIRLSPVLYICLEPNNIVQHRYDSTFAMAVSGWVLLQIILLACQTVFGPRFFLPKGYLPSLYDYHPVITEDDLETGFNYNDLKVDGSGSEDSHTALLSKSKPKVDCAICMMPIELVVVPRDRAQAASTPANILARRRYMVTPCKHVFHSECMERWMRTRLQCPVCRNPLPPI